MLVLTAEELNHCKKCFLKTKKSRAHAVSEHRTMIYNDLMQICFLCGNYLPTARVCNFIIRIQFYGQESSGMLEERV